jgi:deoxyribose-phosphate aldolase
VLVCPVIGFPHGNSTAEVKVFEARRAAEEGGKEIDMVVNIGRVLSGKWDYVKDEIYMVNKTVVEAGAILKVIFENDCAYPFSLILRFLEKGLWRKANKKE